jgi:hypothetical protein
MGTQPSERTGLKPIEALHRYLAGYLDGEGCFTYHRTPTVDISSIYPYTLQIFHDEYGGRIHQRDGPGRCWYQWRVYGKSAIKLIADVLPYLHEKRAQALLVLEIRNLEPGPQRSGLIAQLKHFKRIEYPDGPAPEETKHAPD